MWYIAAKFTSEQESLLAYTPVQTWLKSLDHTAKLTASVLRIQLKGKPHVTIVGNFEHQVTAQLHTKICEFLKNGNLVELDNHTLQAIAERRSERMQHIKYDDKKGTGYSETHDPFVQHRIDITKPVSGFVNAANLYDLPVKKELPAVDASKPLIVQFEKVNNLIRGEEFKELNRMMGYPSGQDIEVVRLFNRVGNQKYKKTQKYIFAQSALQLHASLLQHDQSSLDIAEQQYTWIECEQAIATPYGPIRALFLNDSYDIDIIDKLVGDYQIASIMKLSIENHKDISGLEIVNDRLETIFDFSYRRDRKEWVYLRSHKCLSGKCVYPDDETTDDIPMLSVCEECREACLYFARWLVLAMAMINGEYALDANGESFSSQLVEYEDVKKVLVGKGKNKRMVNQPIKKEVEYTLVTYDVTKVKQLHSEPTGEIRGENWLTLHDKDDIVYQRRKIAAYNRHLPRKEGIITVQSHSKYVPMLRTAKPRIVKIVASQPEEEK